MDKPACYSGEFGLNQMPERIEEVVAYKGAHLAEPAVVEAEKSQMRDLFGFIRLKEGRYTTADIDTAWTMGLGNDFLNWFQASEQAEIYRHLTWAEELEEARKLEGQGPSSSIRL